MSVASNYINFKLLMNSQGVIFVVDTNDRDCDSSEAVDKATKVLSVA